MVDCPECGKPMKKNGHKSKYSCENNACSVIFVCHPDKPPLIRISRKASSQNSIEVDDVL